MLKLVVLFLMPLTVNTAVAQKTKLNLEFDHEWSLWKYLVIQVRGPETRSLAYREPYVHSATIKLTINLNGEITDLGFIEKAEDEVYNELFEKLARTTSGKWKFVEIADSVEQIYVILPFLHKTPPDLKADYPLDLEEQFNTYHKSLSFETLEGCDETNCVIWKQNRNYTGVPIR